MRASHALALVVAAFGCRSAPESAPTRTEAPAPKKVQPPLALTELTARGESLTGLTLQLEGTLGPGVRADQIAWTVKDAEKDALLGEGTTPISADQQGHFTAELPVKWGSSVEEIGAYKDRTALELHAEVSAGEGGPKEMRAVRVRAPKLPEASILTVQASRNGPQALGLTYSLSVMNPNLFEIRLTNLHYTALLSGKNIATGDVQPGRVPPNAASQYELPAEANAQNCGKEIGPMLKQSELPWGFQGSYKLSGLEVPFDLSGTLRLSKE